MYEVYKITNLVNNKVYIGQTTRGIKARFNRHIRDARLIFLIKGVSTIPDECKGVGLEIGTSPKRKTTLMSRRYSQCRW